MLYVDINVYKYLLQTYFEIFNFKSHEYSPFCRIHLLLVIQQYNIINIAIFEYFYMLKKLLTH